MRDSKIFLSLCCAAALLAQSCGALKDLPEKGAELPVDQKDERAGLFGNPARAKYELVSNDRAPGPGAPDLPEYEIDYQPPPPSESTGRPIEPELAAASEPAPPARPARSAKKPALKAERSSRAARAEAATRIIDTALMFHGAPYKWGGDGPGGVDCSGLVCAAYRAAGMQLPRTSPEQAAAGEVVGKDEIRPGDLLFFEASRKGEIGHSALVVEAKDGSVKFIHATPSHGVRFDFLEAEHWRTHFVAARRYF